MTPPADHRSTLRALVEAGEEASRGKWRVVPKRYEVESAEGSVAAAIGRCDGHFIVTAANARPALASIERKVWLDVEVVRHLIGECFQDSLHVTDEHQAALAAAEAELRAVEERCT